MTDLSPSAYQSLDALMRQAKERKPDVDLETECVMKDVVEELLSVNGGSACTVSEIADCLAQSPKIRDSHEKHPQPSSIITPGLYIMRRYEIASALDRVIQTAQQREENVGINSGVPSIVNCWEQVKQILSLEINFTGEGGHATTTSSDDYSNIGMAAAMDMDALAVAADHNQKVTTSTNFHGLSIDTQAHTNNNNTHEETMQQWMTIVEELQGDPVLAASSLQTFLQANPTLAARVQQRQQQQQQATSNFKKQKTNDYNLGWSNLF